MMHNFFCVIDVKQDNTGVCNYLRGILKTNEPPRADIDKKKRTSEMLYGRRAIDVMNGNHHEYNV
jgi:hypothetical protein